MVGIDRLVGVRGGGCCLVGELYSGSIGYRFGRTWGFFYSLVVSSWARAIRVLTSEDPEDSISGNSLTRFLVTEVSTHSSHAVAGHARARPLEAVA